LALGQANLFASSNSKGAQSKSFVIKMKATLNSTLWHLNSLELRQAYVYV